MMSRSEIEYQAAKAIYCVRRGIDFDFWAHGKDFSPENLIEIKKEIERLNKYWRMYEISIYRTCRILLMLKIIKNVEGEIKLPKIYRYFEKIF